QCRSASRRHDCRQCRSGRGVYGPADADPSRCETGSAEARPGDTIPVSADPGGVSMGRPTRTPPDVKRGEVQPPTVLNKVAPEYSEEARKAKLQGVVVLSIIIDETGLAQNIKVVRALGLGEDFFACTIVVANATEIAEAEK